MDRMHPSQKVRWSCVVGCLFFTDWVTNLNSILKSRDITLLVHLVKAMVFPIVIYGCESWTIKKAERRRIDAFELWCWRRLLRVPWTARRSSQSILKAISPEYSWEGLMLKLKLQYFGHLMQRAGSLEKTLMLGKIEGRRERGRQRVRWLDGITHSMDLSLSKLREMMKDREAWPAEWQRVRHGLATEQQQISVAKWEYYFNSSGERIQFSSVDQLYPILCDSRDCSTPGLPGERVGISRN